MAITVTTLAGAVAINDKVVNVASATGITAPNDQTGVGITYLFIDQELMKVWPSTVHSSAFIVD